MKTCATLFLCITIFCIPHLSYSQCGNGVSSISYDTILTGGGNDYHLLNFPRFDGSLGTLTEIQYTTVVTMKYQFALENRSAAAIKGYRITIGREDLFLGETILVPQENTMTPKNFGPYNFQPNDGVAGSGADYIGVGPTYLLKDDTSIHQFFNTADYLGTGDFELEYYSQATSTLKGDPSISFTGNATDTILFRMTYIYCPNVVLAADLTGFTAQKKENDIFLRWNVANEEKDRTYILEKSYDGQTFTTAQRIFSRTGSNGMANYQFVYNTTDSERGKIIFRLKQVDKDGKIRQSGLRVIQLTERSSSRLIVYPNPARGVAQILFNNSKRGDWQLEVFSSSGILVQKEVLKNVLMARINPQARFTKGLYFIKARNLQSGEMFVERLMLQ